MRALLSRLDPGVVPPLLAASGTRVLLTEVPGEDHYDAPLAVLLRIVGILVGLQVTWSGREAELLALGLPDWRSRPMTELVADVVARNSADLDAATRATLDALLAGLPRRWADTAACGIPETLVHGDFHPGNVLGNEERLVLLDWGDSGVGHPLLDVTAFLERRSDTDRRAIRAHWWRLWRAAVPGSDPARAAELLAPVAALRQALIYQGFLDRIEASERVYHADDPVFWLRRAAALAASPPLS